MGRDQPSGFVRRGPSLVCGAAVIFVVTSGCLERREGDTTPVQDECTPCHGGLSPELDKVPGSAAPPYNLSGQTERSAAGNGAHLAHLLGTENSRAVACQECHLVPDDVDSPGHLDDPHPAEVIFSGPARAFKAEPEFLHETGTCENTFCHGDSFVGFRPSGGFLTVPSFTDESGKAAECGACHALPPPLPHPPESECSVCHKNIDEEGVFVRPDLHVNGVVNFFLPGADR